MYENIKLIVADIDETLAPAATYPSEYTIHTIERLKEAGKILALASGRPIDDIIDRYQLWGLKDQFDFLIGWNGAELYDHKTKTKHQYNLLKKQWIKEIIEFMSEFEPHIHMYLPGIYLSSVESDRAWFSAYKNKRQFVVASNISDFYQVDNAGIMFRCDISKMDKIREKLITIKDKDYIGFNTQVDLFEFSHRDSNKGYALKQYLDFYSISPDDCLSFGDTTNDIEMFKNSVGVCMLSGTKDAKEFAKIITDKTCKGEGFAHFIEDYLL